MKHIRYLKLILYMMKPWMNWVSLSSDISPSCISMFAGSDLAQRLSVGFIIWGVIVFLFQFDLIIDEGHNCQHRYLAPLFQCMVPTPVIVPNRHSPEKYSVISRKYFRFQTCVVGPSKLVVGHIDNRPVAMGLPIKHLTLIPETNYNLEIHHL